MKGDNSDWNGVGVGRRGRSARRGCRYRSLIKPLHEVCSNPILEQTRASEISSNSFKAMWLVNDRAGTLPPKYILM